MEDILVAVGLLTIIAIVVIGIIKLIEFYVEIEYIKDNYANKSIVALDIDTLAHRVKCLEGLERLRSKGKK